MEFMLGDRRAGRRYDMQLPVIYRLQRGSRVLYEGRGTTANMSRGGVALKTERFLPSGLSIQMWIEWPILLHARKRMLLRVAGRILRCDGEEVAIRTTWHEFIRAENPVEREDNTAHEAMMVA